MSLSLSLEVDGRRGFCGAPGHTLPRVLIVGTGHISVVIFVVAVVDVETSKLPNNGTRAAE